MSQAKVDRYKEEKANRKKIMAKEKKRNQLYKLIACLVAVALVAWLGYSVYGVVTRPPTSDIELTTDSLDTYLASLEEDEEETEEEETSTDEEETEEAEEDASDEETSEDDTSEDEAAEDTEDESEETSEEADGTEGSDE